MEHLRTFKENVSYITYKNDDNVDEGLKHWLATFLLLANMGLVPISVQKAGGW